MATNKRRKTQKPSVYLSARPTLPPPLMQLVRSVARHVRLTSGTDDPETAYAAIHGADVLLCYLNRETCQQLIALYELGVAVVFHTPVIMIREANLTLTQLLIRPHYYETEFLVRPTAGRFQSHRFPGQMANPRSLGHLLAEGYKNAVVFSPGAQSSCMDELLARILKLGQLRAGVALRHLKSSGSHPKGKSLVRVTKTMRKHQLKPLAEGPGLSSHKQPVGIGLPLETSLIPLCTRTNYMTNLAKENNNETASLVLVNFPQTVDELTSTEKKTEESADQSVSSFTQDVVHLDAEVPKTSIVPTPVPSPEPPKPPKSPYYPTALPAIPMDVSFPPFRIEELAFNKYALAIARSDRLPSVIRRRIMRKDV